MAAGSTRRQAASTRPRHAMPSPLFLLGREKEKRMNLCQCPEPSHQALQTTLPGRYSHSHLTVRKIEAPGDAVGAQSQWSRKGINVLSTCDMPAAFPRVHSHLHNSPGGRLCHFHQTDGEVEAQREGVIASTARQWTSQDWVCQLSKPTLPISPRLKTLGICSLGFSETPSPAFGSHFSACLQASPSCLVSSLEFVFLTPAFYFPWPSFHLLPAGLPASSSFSDPSHPP